MDEIENYCDAHGAAKLKVMIEQYWGARGHCVSVMLVQAPFSAPIRAARVDLRSDLVNGLPLERRKHEGALTGGSGLSTAVGAPPSTLDQP
jgi:hypothetical protein